jgi:hypothetical protein
LVFCATIYLGKMSRMKIRKVKNLKVTRYAPISSLDSLTITYTNFLDGRDHYARYHEIYHIFQNEEYSFDDKDIFNINSHSASYFITKLFMRMNHISLVQNVDLKMDAKYPKNSSNNVV